MSAPNALDVCRKDLFTSETELLQKYSETLVKKILRIREMHNWFVSNPESTDREFVAEVMQRHQISKVTAYADLRILKDLLPAFSQASHDFHRWRYNEMILSTYRMAEKRKDTKTMEKAATSYGKFNRVDLEDEQTIPYDKIVPQQFTATDDPRTLGIEPIPNIQEKISAMIAKYRAESMDIEDVGYEEVDLELDTLFPIQQTNQSDLTDIEP